MENVCENITLDLLDIHSMAAITVNQGDTARILKIYFEEQGVPYRLGDGCFAVLVGKKPDGTFLYNPCAIEKDHVIYQFTPQTASAQGEVNCEIRLYDSNDQMITSGKFQIFVMEPICIDDLVESKEEVTVLTHLVSEAATVIRDGNNLLLQGKNVLETAEDVLEEAKQAKAESCQAAEVAAKEADNAMRIVGDANKVILQANQAAANADSAAARANGSSELAVNAYALAQSADSKVDTLREVVSKFHNNIVCEETGEVIILSDSAEVPLQSLKLYGKTTQNGTPTPDAPMALESVGDGGTVSVTACGKNLLDESKLLTSSGTGRYTENMDEKIHFVNTDGLGFAPSITLTLPPGTYYFGASIEIIIGTPYYGYYINDGPSVWGANRFLTITEISQVTFRLTTDGTKEAGEYYANFWLTAGDTVTTYVPYTGTTATVTPVDSSGKSLQLPGIPVTSGGNYTDPVTKQQWLCDEVDFAKGVYVQRVNVVELENFTFEYNSDTTGQALCRALFTHPANVSDLSVTHGAMCDKLPELPYAHINGTRGSWFGIYRAGVRVTVEGATTADAVNARLGKVTIAYPLEAHIEHKLAAFDTMHTNYPNTTVFNDAGAHMEVSYIADTQKYVDKKFEALEAAIASLI